MKVNSTQTAIIQVRTTTELIGDSKNDNKYKRNDLDKLSIAQEDIYASVV